MLEVVGNVVRGKGQRQGWGRRVEFLLRLAPLCEGLLSSISQDCLQLGIHTRVCLNRLGMFSLVHGSSYS